MNIRNLFKKFLPSTEEEKSFDTLIDAAYNEVRRRDIYYWTIKLGDIEATSSVLSMPDRNKVGFVSYLLHTLHAYRAEKTSYSTNDPEFIKAHLKTLYLTYVLRTKLILEEKNVNDLTTAFTTLKHSHWADITAWPLALFVAQVNKSFPGALPESVRQNLHDMKQEIIVLQRSEKEITKLVDKIDSVLFRSQNEKEAIRPVSFSGGDQFGPYANEVISSQPDDEKIIWYQLIANAQKANGSKPSAKFIETNKALTKQLQQDKFKKIVTDWFDFVARMKETTEERTSSYNNQPYTYTTTEFLMPQNVDALKGIVWMCAQFHDINTLHALAKLAEKSFRKIPGKGPAAASVGNACIYTLYKSKGLEGISHLSRLKLRVRQTSTQNLIEKYLQEAATAEGITVTEIEDLAVADFGLVNGRREYEMDGYKAVIVINGIGDVALDWFKPDNTPQKSVPALVKDQHASRLKEIKDTHKQIEVALTAQRDRVDRMLRSARKMTWTYFVKYYLDHGLMSLLTRRIVWKFDAQGTTHHCLFQNDQWKTLGGETIIPDDSFQVSLWHPCTATLQETRSWRELLMKEKILQPIKQVFREVYLLTDAEVSTNIYSNRMAAHLLKQHQFSSLAKIRGWKYSLLGAYDDGRYNEGAELTFPENNLRAEFWVSEVNADNAFNDTGIWDYIATDQVRFVNTTTTEPVELVTVPPIVFSEVMRDIDMFVGVASVGNDPNWRDSGGLTAYRDYWQEFSFGDLTEIAKTRKEILQNLVPRLKIAPVASIQDRFLVVKGKKRTYKIHLGSTNILMEPNDQYLCIVPDRSKKDTTSNVFLPFEGDAGLSVILSKAMLLADDDKITDPTIISQINRR